jgi:hypothetical protein
MAHLYKFVRLPLPDQWVTIKSTALVVVVRTALRWLKFERVHRWLTRGENKSHARYEQPDMDQVKRTIWAVNTVSNIFLPSGPCLTNALVTQRLLNRLAYPTTLRIGVRFGDDGGLQAHAWLEREGKIVTGKLANHADFTPLPPLRH